jgi:FMNH2-dependent dimethyl sulfone monooxygenase
MFGGDALVGDDDRYIRAEEFTEILRGLWRQTPYSHSGAFYTIEGAELRLKPATAEPPEIFTASRSERGLEMVAKIADWWFVDFDKRAQTPDDYMEGVQRSIEGMRRRAEKYGRKVRFALNPFIGFGDSDEAALAHAKELLAPDPGDGDVRKLMQRIGPAMLSGCIGRPETVRKRLEAFAAAGVELFLFKFAPTMENVRAIRDEIIIPFRSQAMARQLAHA